jgi:hypothetical protein
MTFFPYHQQRNDRQIENQQKLGAIRRLKANLLSLSVTCTFIDASNNALLVISTWAF